MDYIAEGFDKQLCFENSSDSWVIRKGPVAKYNPNFTGHQIAATSLSSNLIIYMT